ncbi:hydroxymethylpyrimidine/phosphomethylpyrimidine kinase [Desulfotomaculum arcticum]|uniref:Hydroxymethylpyrimidine/phosphomethylpyrimidine kinase n=1 Tax=Desulfotruncus arcticus DSM 17038 TaxID=1121424 RepID=A0A1I2Q3V2_9FIRM|nr:bifunctional hydroxymethylpyrimidine kinase/phosphomethylpyrimidine kinase [Desulfotruncus arcticus]SFG23014.1 hydroxymethylpyrimidine/phosphomethylpyrimidine kinase [Desulfotomaculum arcticum] [Desulfotruncus arcticus DSM 17038]
MIKVLTIAGSDSCGGAGIQADLKTFSALGTYGMSVITAVTAQNTRGVFNVRELDQEIIRDQISAIFEDIQVDAVKIGMVSSAAIIETIGESLLKNKAQNIVVDPVMVSKSGCALLQPEAREALIRVLLPLAEVVTPNLFEAEVITETKIATLDEMEKAAVAINKLGAKNVVVKGGHLKGDAIDVLYSEKAFRHFGSGRVATPHTHGTGCTFSSAIAASLAKGCPVEEAVARAKEYIGGAIAHSFPLGRGVGPTHHFYQYYRDTNR